MTERKGETKNWGVCKSPKLKELSHGCAHHMEEGGRVTGVLFRSDVKMMNFMYPQIDKHIYQ